MNTIRPLHHETVSPFMLMALHALMTHPGMDAFQLAGGTSIALLLGHRHSIDLDLFTDKPFTSDQINPILAPFFPLDQKESRIGISYRLPAPVGQPDLKVDVCNWHTPFLHPPVVVDGLRLTDLRDSCADKLNALTDR